MPRSDAEPTDRHDDHAELRWRQDLPWSAWKRSMLFRVVVTTMIGAVLVTILGGILLMRQASAGILAAKRQASVQEASTALERMQEQLREGSSDSISVYERLNQLATDAGQQAGQFRIIIQGPVSGYVSFGIDSSSLPGALVTQVETSSGMYLAPTLVRYTDHSQADEPGLVVGASLYSPTMGESYPVYFIFPLGKEVQTLQVVERSAISTGAVLVLALTLLAGVVTRQVVRPVRQARVAAERLASGHLEERMAVRGTADLASLATSMNNMATEIQQKINELEELSRLQQQFVSDVSHELRTPLTTVRMASELIYDQRGQLDASTARSAELLEAQVDRFEELLSDLLEISRFDAGAAVLASEDTDLAGLVRAEADAQAPFAERMGTPLLIEVRGDTRAEIDPRRVTRILRNLITNAIEHGEAQPIRIVVAGDDDAVAVVVRDRGVGFLPAQSDLVFHRFWRADPSRNRTVGGTGLGLAIALEDAQLHHGWLQAWGRPHQGAQFLLTLPRRPDVVLTGSPLTLVPEDVLARRRMLTDGRPG